MWWGNMPGLYVDNPMADRVIAFVCAERVQPSEVGRGAWGSSSTRQLANDFLRWLQQAKDLEDNIARRVALCVACEDTSGRARGQHLAAAKNTYQYLTEGATTVGEQTRWQREAG
jgi:hypothetical protein